MLLLLLLLSGPCLFASVAVTNLKTEYLTNPLGLDRLHPRFQWDLVGEATTRGLVQKSYHIKVGTVAADGSVWDSGVVASNKTYQIEYTTTGYKPGRPLASATVYRWAVTVTTTTTAATTLEAASTTSTSTSVTTTTAATTTASAPALFSMGILTDADWTASGSGVANFIGKSSTGLKRSPWFRKTFTMPAALPAAALDAAAGAGGGGAAQPSPTALVHLASVGYHELYVNGMSAASLLPSTANANGEPVLLPSVSYLPKRVLYVGEDS
jgi:alpha-L-rhamnosidase